MNLPSRSDHLIKRLQNCTIDFHVMVCHPLDKLCKPYMIVWYLGEILGVILFETRQYDRNIFVNYIKSQEFWIWMRAAFQWMATLRSKTVVQWWHFMMDNWQFMDWLHQNIHNQPLWLLEALSWEKSYPHTSNFTQLLRQSHRQLETHLSQDSLHGKVWLW